MHYNSDVSIEEGSAGLNLNSFNSDGRTLRVQIDLVAWIKNMIKSNQQFLFV